ECRMPYDNTGSKNTVQSMGSAITYARRYSLSALVGVVADDDDDGEGAWRRDADREPPRRNAPEPAPQPKPERVNLAALAKALSEVRDSAGSSPATAIGYEEHPDYEAVKNMFGKKRREIETKAEAEAGTPPEFVPLDAVIAAFEAAETVTALKEAATRLGIPENHPDSGAIYAAYRERLRKIEAQDKECAA
ncbi:MAG: ERF family protein, partial [Bilophila wadsworthia]